MPSALEGLLAILDLEELEVNVFRGEPFWGQDRMPLLEERLHEAGLER